MTSTLESPIVNEPFTWKPLFAAGGRFVVLLLVTQALRAGVYQALLYGLARSGQARTQTSLTVISLAAFLVSGLMLLLALRPRAGQLGLAWQGASRRERTLTFAGGLLLLALAITGILIDSTQWLPMLSGCLVTPVFEELIFRGWGWGQLEARFPARWRGWGTLIWVTALFGLWHLGYFYEVSLRMALHPENSASLGLVMGMKVVIGAAVGLLAGLARWRSGRVYAPMLIHALWNLFGK